MNQEQDSPQNIDPEQEKEALTKITQELGAIDTLIHSYDREEQKRLDDEEAEDILHDLDTL